MPYVLRNKQSNEIYACTMSNIYDLPYYGAKSWEDRGEAERERDGFLTAAQASDPEAWELVEVEEHRLKLFNVKLKNNPQRRLFLNADGSTNVTEISQ